MASKEIINEYDVIPVHRFDTQKTNKNKNNKLEKTATLPGMLEVILNSR